MQQNNSFKNELIGHRRYLHQNAETGFDLPKTKAYVKNVLNQYGYKPISCGKCGMYATIGRGDTCILLRADMDALPLEEQTNLSFSSLNKEKMHACGHDMHTAMLLGAAKLLKEKEHQLNGIVKLMFQPAEESLQGAKDMIASGVLKNPIPNAALALHVSSGIPLETGTAIVSAPGTVAPSSDHFEITVMGKGCHGSMPQNGKDSVLTAAHLIIALQALQTREFAAEKVILTFGTFHSGSNSNIIPEKAVLTGTLRTFDENTRKQIKEKIPELLCSIANAFGCTADIRYTTECPALYCNKCLSDFALKTIKGTVRSDSVPKGSGSEDFAFISHEIPSVLIYLPSGDSRKGYTAPLHNPKVIFDEDVLTFGAEIYADFAIKYFNQKLP